MSPQLQQPNLLEKYAFLKDKELTDDLKKFLVEKSIDANNAEWTRTFEIRKWRWGTPLAIALTGGITIAINFFFDYWRTSQTQALKEQSDDAEARRKGTSAERDFEFKILERELGQDRSESERAKTLLFLVRAGVLNRLNVAELRAMAEATLKEGGQTASSVGVPSFGQRPIIEGPKVLTPEIRRDFESFFDGLKLKNLKADQFLVTGQSNSDPSSGAYGINSYPPKDLWPNIRDVMRALDIFVDRYGAPIETINVFRGTLYNAALGGAASSTHTKFQAVDFRVPTKGTVKEWAALLRQIRSEGVFRGGIGIEGGHVHIDARGSNADWGG